MLCQVLVKMFLKSVIPLDVCVVKVFRPCEIFVFPATGKTFVVDCECLLGCKSKYIIYLLTCGEYGFQHVGKTSQYLHQHLNGHRSAVSSGIKTYLNNHFTEVGHVFSSCSI